MNSSGLYCALSAALGLVDLLVTRVSVLRHTLSFIYNGGREMAYDKHKEVT